MKKEVVGELGEGLKGNCILEGCQTYSQRGGHGGQRKAMNGCGELR